MNRREGNTWLDGVKEDIKSFGLSPKQPEKEIQG